ncbi:MULTISPECIES: DUF7674 family protein [Paenibacillus]|uniref:DUF7674 family protein n=1 Tax=Paenibacillus TaxID=44249 RepID=UPI00117E06A6|nr:hypothetical protein [Paenibacillus odorifer]
MSAWRRIAQKLFYDLRFHFNHKDDSIYSLLVFLRDRIIEAHRNNDLTEQEKIYNYAEWCFNQYKRSPYMHNAICVGFYEHLVEDESTLQAIPYKVKPYIFKDLQGLFEWMLNEDKDRYIKLVEEYNRVNSTDFNR